MDPRAAREFEALIDAEISAGRQRTILVDAINVLNTALLGKEREDTWWRSESRERLLRRVSAWPEGPDEIWSAFDGPSPAWSVWAERASISGSPGSHAVPTTLPAPQATVHHLYVVSADDWIVRRARRSPSPTTTIVVSNDQQVSGRARSAGCEVWTPWDFMAKCPEVEATKMSCDSEETASQPPS